MLQDNIFKKQFKNYQQEKGTKFLPSDNNLLFAFFIFWMIKKHQTSKGTEINVIYFITNQRTVFVVKL